MKPNVATVGALSLTFVLGVILLCRIFVFEIRRIPSSSMVPSYKPGDIVLVYKYGYGTYRLGNFTFYNREPSVEIKAGQSLVFKHPVQTKIDYLKRVVGLPHDKVTLRHNALFVNDIQVPAKQVHPNHPHIYEQTLDGTTFNIRLESDPDKQATHHKPAKTWQVPDKHLFVLGDHRDRSNDSRYWGFVPNNHVIGIVKLRLWPLKKSEPNNVSK